MSNRALATWLVAVALTTVATRAHALTLELDVANAEAVRRELDNELSTLEPPPDGSLRVVDVSPASTRVTYRAADGRTLERVIEVHADADARAKEIALLASSLVRDSASSLVPPPAPEPPAPPPAPANKRNALRMHVDGWINPEYGLGAAAFVLGGKHWQALAGVGGKVSLGSTAGLDAVLVLGGGTRVPLGERVALEVDALFHVVHRFDDDDTLGLQPQLRATAHVRVARAVALFAGPTLNLLYTPERDLRRTPSFTAQLGSDEPGVELWPGLVLGARLLPEERSRR